MKKIISALVIAAITFASCNNADKKNANVDVKVDSSGTAMQSDNMQLQTKLPIHGILTGYLNLKNSLAADNGNDAAKNGQEILDAVSKFDASALTPEQKKVFLSLVGDIKENSEHINKNGDKIDHQREHFEMLSKDMYDLLKATGASKTMYLDSCPMYDGGKGTWLSEMKEIKNPYLGKKMPTCGSIKETL